MRRLCLGLSIAALAALPAAADKASHPSSYDDFIAAQAQKHGVPERLIHRIVQRESRYNPGLVHNACFGLMQIKYGTARSMGYTGSAQGLLDPHVNMTYAIPYLANAYRIAGGNEDRAVQLYAAGYYYTARSRQMIGALRTADSPPISSAALTARAPESFAAAEAAPRVETGRVDTPPAPTYSSGTQTLAYLAGQESAAPDARTAIAAAARSETGAAPAQAAEEEPNTGSKSRARHDAKALDAKALKIATATDPAEATAPETKAPSKTGKAGRQTARAGVRDATPAADPAVAAELAQTRQATAAFAEPSFDDGSQKVAPATNGKGGKFAHKDAKIKVASAKPIKSAALLRADTASDAGK